MCRANHVEIEKAVKTLMDAVQAPIEIDLGRDRQKPSFLIKGTRIGFEKSGKRWVRVMKQTSTGSAEMHDDFNQLANNDEVLEAIVGDPGVLEAIERFRSELASIVGAQPESNLRALGEDTKGQVKLRLSNKVRFCCVDAAENAEAVMAAVHRLAEDLQ